MSEQTPVPQYVITQDTLSMFSRINPEIDESKVFAEASNRYLESISASLEIGLADEISVRRFYEEEINTRLRNKIDPLLSGDDTICICLDRFLLDDVERDEAYQQRFYRFSMARSVDGAKVPRQGALSFEKQLETVRTAARGKKVVIVDDGFFSGGTIRDFLDMAKSRGLELDVEKIVGFISGGVSTDNSFQEKVDVVEQIEDLYDWVDIRDFGPMGGKRYEVGRNNNVSTSVPYIYPWSEGGAASLNMSPELFNISRSMIYGFRDLLKTYEESYGPLNFRQLVKSGFPLPTDIEKRIPISINDNVIDYLDRCLGIIDKEEKRDVMVFDMDGTLYELDGAEKGYKGSTLEARVIENSQFFIMRQEGCPKVEAKQILDQALRDGIGASNYLSKKYGITRQEYFDFVWNVDPKDIIKNFEVSVAAVKDIKRSRPNNKFVLLTSAPRVWAEKVLQFAQLDDVFESRYTGEQFGVKDEIFEMLAGRYCPQRIISIGDQVETDINPAKKLGMKGFYISNPSEIRKLAYGMAYKTH